MKEVGLAYGGMAQQYIELVGAKKPGGKNSDRKSSMHTDDLSLIVRTEKNCEIIELDFGCPNASISLDLEAVEAHLPSLGDTELSPCRRGLIVARST